LLFAEGKDLKADIPEVPVKSSIGSGDATVAGFSVGLLRGYSLEDCLRLAMACGMSNAMSRQVGVVEKQTVEDLLPRILVTPRSF